MHIPPSNVRGLPESLVTLVAALPINEEDTVIFPIYRDVLQSGEILTKGELVLAGTETQANHPTTREYPLHFRKTYTPKSPPLLRGETPEAEYLTTTKIRAHLPPSIAPFIQPLGYDTLIYRSTAIWGQTFEALSPLAKLPYELACRRPLGPKQVTHYYQQIQKSYAIIGALHRAGVTHGDLHLGNLLWLHSGEPIPIDFATAILRCEISPTLWTDTTKDDKVEILREAALLQLNRGVQLPGEAFTESIRLADELLPTKIATQLQNLSPRIALASGHPTR